MISEEIKKAGVKVLICISETSLPIIEEYSNGIRMGAGYFSHEEVANVVIQSIETGVVRTPVLPRNTLRYTEMSKERIFLFIEVPEHRRTVLYHEASIEDVSYPKLVFGFELLLREEKWLVSSIYVAALEDQMIPNEDSLVYFYPFTNVDKHKVCMGGQSLPLIDRISQLSTTPELFFQSTNSDCYYSDANNSGLKFRDLVADIQGKNFPQEYLKPTGKTLSAWMDLIANRKF